MLLQLWAVIIKELQLLRRDRGGLAVLFIMPVALVLVVCLVQDNILKTSGAAAVEVLVVDHDQATFGPWLMAQLRQQGDVHLSLKMMAVPLSRRNNAWIVETISWGLSVAGV